MTSVHQTLVECLGSHASKIDEGTLQYISTVIADSTDPEEAVETVAPFLLDSGVVQSQSQAAEIVLALLAKAGKNPHAKKDKGPQKLAAPIKIATAPPVASSSSSPAPAVAAAPSPDASPSEGTSSWVPPEPAAIDLTGDLLAYFDQGETLFSGRKITLTIEDTLILENTNLSLIRGHRYGLIGPNGAGKTTLLNALKTILTEKGARVQYVGQNDGERLAASKLSLIEHVLNGDPKRTGLSEEIEQLSAIPGGELEAEQAERLSEAMAELEEMGGEEQARAMLKQLGFTNPDAPVSRLSGGWRSRLEVARALWVRSDLLLLDEPTNHMDLEAVLQLGSILLEDSKRTVVIVSHDAAFLDLVSTDTLCLHYGAQLLQYDGNYASFEEHAKQYRTFHEDIYDARERKEKAWKESVQQMKQRAAREGDSARAQQAAARAKKIDRIGLYREDGKKFKTRSLKVLDAAFIRLPARAEPVKDAKEVNMHLPAWITPLEPEEQAGQQEAGGDSTTTVDLLQASPMIIGPTWGPKGTPLVRTPPLNVAPGDRIAIVGANGCGKTTLLRVLAGQAKPGAVAGDGSAVHANSSVVVIDQNQLASLDGEMELTPIEWIIKRMGAEGRARPNEDARKQLSCFAIVGDTAETPISELSGGLRVRLLLAGAFVGSPRILLLDEPTNHLDGESIMALVQLCKTFPGAIVGISHNVAFLLQVFKDLWIIQDGVLKVQKTLSSSSFAQVFSAYALPLVPVKHRSAFDAMLKIRAAKSAIVIQQAGNISSLVV